MKIQTIIPNGLRMVGYSDAGITSFYVVSANPEVAEREIKAKLGI